MIASCKRSEVARIVQLVAEEYGITPERILGKSRLKSTSEARLLCYYLARQTTRLSLPEIADCLRRGDHSTILTGVRSCERRLAADAWLRGTMARVLARLDLARTCVEEAVA